MTRLANVFDEVTIEVMAQAVTEACAAVKPPSSVERDLIAKRVLGTAALGERDGNAMREDAIAYING